MQFLDILWLGMPVWIWLTFLGAVLAILAFDLGVMHRDSHEIGVGDVAGDRAVRAGHDGRTGIRDDERTAVGVGGDFERWIGPLDDAPHRPFATRRQRGAYQRPLCPNHRSAASVSKDASATQGMSSKRPMP